jgi:hypothetical protein
MRKGLIVLLVAVVAVAFALPATADMTPTNLNVSGFYRSKAWLSNFHDGSGAPSLRTGTAGDSEQTNAYVEQRARVKFAFGTENVQAVWFLESDMVWGDSAGGTPVANTCTTNTAGVTCASTYGGGAQRNSGGALGGDRVQIETKNLYLWFKVPDTSVGVTVGLQGQSDDYAGILYGGADFAGVFVTGKYEPVTWKLGWAKLYENVTQKSDDMTLYVAEAKFAPAKDVKLGLNFYFLQDDSAKNLSATALPFAVTAGNQFSARVYMPGVSAAFKAGPATISGFAQYQFGTIESVNVVAPDIDINAYLFDLRADMNLGPGKFFIEGLYLSGGDGTGNDYEAPITLSTREASPGGNSAYSRTNMAILLASPDTINISQCLIGCSGGELGADPGNGGQGIWHVAAGYQQKLTPKLTGQVNVGYLAATEELTGGTSKGKEIGTEINARIDYNLAKGLDVGLVGAYAFIGDFLNTTGSPDFEDAWTSYARVNYAF